MKMATDLKMELFAYNIFQTAFLSHKLIRDKQSICQIYGDGFFDNPNDAEVCDDMFHKAIFCHRELFQIVYKGELMYEKIESCKSPSDLFDYLIIRCDQDYLFHNLNVFQRMFATCAFVVSICVHVYWYNVVDVISYGHLFWALIFDQYIEEFYKEGGWNELKRVAKTYGLLYEFLALFPENFNNYFRTIKEAIVNYCHFKEVAFSTECKHVSKMWVRFRIENFGNYVKMPVSYEISLNPLKIELLMEELKQLCDPRPKEAFKYVEQFRDSGSKVEFFNEFLSTNDSNSGDISLGRYRVKNDYEFISTADDSVREDISPEGYQANTDYEFILTSDNSVCNDIFPEKYEVKLVNEFVSTIDNFYNPVEDSNSDNISPEKYELSSFNEFISKDDLSSSMDDSDSDDFSSFMDDSDSEEMPQERYQSTDFPVGMSPGNFKTISEITAGLDLKIRPSLLEHKDSVVDTCSGKLPNSSIEYNKTLQKMNSVAAVDHLRKNENLEYEEKTCNVKGLSTNRSKLDLNVYSINKHNIFSVEDKCQSFESITEKPRNSASLNRHITNYDQNPDDENEMGTVNNLHLRNTRRQRETDNVVEDEYINENRLVESVLDEKSHPKNPRTLKELFLFDELVTTDSEKENIDETMHAYFDSNEREIDETVKPTNILFTNLNTTSEWNAKPSPDISHNPEDLKHEYVNNGVGKESIMKTTNSFFTLIKSGTNESANSMVAFERQDKRSNIAHNLNDFNHVNATVSSEYKINIIKKRLASSGNEQENDMFKHFSQTNLKT